MLKEVFITLTSPYAMDQAYINILWDDILKNHNKKNRYYHTIFHLESLYKSLVPIKKNINDWDIILFALFYHDYIYNPLKQNNEELSAKKAVTILSLLSIPKERIELCKEIILATKKHQSSKNKDVNYFTDADHSILGTPWQTYQSYFKNVRKEYKYYPDVLYNKGRIKVLQHFIQMPRIYKSDYFYSKLESQAKNNIQKEISILSK